MSLDELIRIALLALPFLGALAGAISVIVVMNSSPPPRRRTRARSPNPRRIRDGFADRGRVRRNPGTTKAPPERGPRESAAYLEPKPLKRWLNFSTRPAESMMRCLPV
ncbi:hypothetical protein GCM10027064_20270 [Microbacterium petrolearium]|jgi:hypothetical protein